MSAAQSAGGILRPGVARRELWAWAMFDFANSGYTTVVITAIFNAYFVSVVAGNAPWATFAWTAALSLSYALIILAAPLLGAFADAGAGKKRLLFLTTAGCVVGTAGLGLADPGSLALALAFLTLSNFCFGSGENLIAAFLPEIAREESLGRVSGWGWGLGYIGGLASLAACLGYIGWAQGQGHAAVDFVPVCLLITAAFFAVASAPTFLFLRDRAPVVAVARVEAAAAFRRVVATLRHARHYRDMRRFMLCILFYQAGIQTVIALAAIYAQQAMGFSMPQTIQLIFVVNITAALGALLFGHVQDRIGHVRALALTLIGWIAMTLIAWSAQDATLFWLAANIAGLCLGASQSAGRALVGLLAPAHRHGEFFGLWGLAVKLSSILGPLTYGAVTWITAGDHRLAILTTGAYFVVGLAILAGVDAERGRRAAATEF
jgi:UMF1 family MFS transporter